MQVEITPPAGADVALERLAVVRAAEGWLGTPYHHMGTVKGAGVDCSMLLAQAYAEAGVIPLVDIGYYPQEWHLHRGEELYLVELLKHAVEIKTEPQPGDVALFQFGRTFSHGAIVTGWPEMIHAYLGVGVVRENYDTATWLQFIGENTSDRGKPRPVRFFTPKRWVGAE